MIAPFTEDIGVGMRVGRNKRSAVIVQFTRGFHAPGKHNSTHQQDSHQGTTDGGWQNVEQARGAGGEFNAYVAFNAGNQLAIGRQIEGQASTASLNVFSRCERDLNLDGFSDRKAGDGVRFNPHRPVRSSPIVVIQYDARKIGVQRRVTVVSDNENLGTAFVSGNALQNTGAFVERGEIAEGGRKHPNGDGF